MTLTQKEIQRKSRYFLGDTERKKNKTLMHMVIWEDNQLLTPVVELEFTLGDDQLTTFQYCVRQS